MFWSYTKQCHIYMTVHNNRSNYLAVVLFWAVLSRYYWTSALLFVWFTWYTMCRYPWVFDVENPGNVFAFVLLVLRYFDTVVIVGCNVIYDVWFSSVAQIILTTIEVVKIYFLSVFSLLSLEKLLLELLNNF